MSPVARGACIWLAALVAGVLAAWIGLGFAHTISERDRPYEIRTPRGWVTCVNDRHPSCDWDHPRQVTVG